MIAEEEFQRLMKLVDRYAVITTGLMKVVKELTLRVEKLEERRQ